MNNKGRNEICIHRNESLSTWKENKQEIIPLHADVFNAREMILIQLGNGDDIWVITTVLLCALSEWNEWGQIMIAKRTPTKIIIADDVELRGGASGIS